VDGVAAASGRADDCVLLFAAACGVCAGLAAGAG